MAIIVKALHKKKWSQLEFNRFPHSPGCYIMKNSLNQVIYIGKAKNLYKRVRSYFYKKQSNEKNKIRKILKDLSQIEFRVCKTELEALILESRLIKQLQPEFNRQLRRYKSYSFIKITTSNPFPRIYSTKNVIDDGNLYFGPFEGNYTIAEEVELINKIFKTRPCHQNIEINTQNPCFYNQINQCLAPCLGKTKKGQYKKIISQMIEFLETGRSTQVDQFQLKLQQQMNQFTQELQFEQAKSKWDQIKTIESIKVKYPFINLIKQNANSLIFIQDSNIISSYHVLDAQISNSMISDNLEDFIDYLKKIKFKDSLSLFNTEFESPAYLFNKDNLDEIKILSRYWEKHQGKKLILNPNEFDVFKDWFYLNYRKNDFNIFSFPSVKLKHTELSCRN